MIAEPVKFRCEPGAKKIHMNPNLCQGIILNLNNSLIRGYFIINIRQIGSSSGF